MFISLERLLKLQVSRWLVVGGATVLIDTVIFTLVFNQINQVLLSNLISGICSTIFNYLMHHKVTFRSEKSHQNSGFRYVVTLIFFWCFNTFTVKIAIMFLSDPALSKLLIAIFQAPLTYLVLNRKVFKA